MLGFSYAKNYPKDWPICERCGSKISTYLIIFGITLIMKCRNEKC